MADTQEPAFSTLLTLGSETPKPKAGYLGLAWPDPPPREYDGTLSVLGVLMISLKRAFLFPGAGMDPKASCI